MSKVGAIEARRDVGDPRVADLEQVVERAVDAGLDVEPHDRELARAHLDLDRVLGRAGRELGLEQQQAVGGAGEQGLQALRLPRAVVADVDQHDGVAGLLGGALRASQHAPEERVRDVGDDERDAARDPGPQRPRRHVRPVPELPRGGLDRLLRARGDAPGRFSGEHERDGGLRDAGLASDVDAGDARRCADYGILGTGGRSRRRGGGNRRARPVPAAPARRRGAALRGGVRARGVPALLGRAVAVGVRAGAGGRGAFAARRARARAGLRARPAVARRRGRRRAGRSPPTGRRTRSRCWRATPRATRCRSRRWSCPGRAGRDRLARAVGSRPRLRRALRAPQRRRAAPAASPVGRHPRRDLARRPGPPGRRAVPRGRRGDLHDRLPPGPRDPPRRRPPPPFARLSCA